MHKLYVLLSLSVISLLLLGSCGIKSDQPAKAVEDYLNAIIEKDADRISALSCPEWQMQALLELDSFQAVETKLEGLACQSQVEDDGTSSVSCTGKISATYNSEVQEFDLSLRTYIITEKGGNYLVCGYR